MDLWRIKKRRANRKWAMTIAYTFFKYLGKTICVLGILLFALSTCLLDSEGLIGNVALHGVMASIASIILGNGFNILSRMIWAATD